MLIKNGIAFSGVCQSKRSVFSGWASWGKGARVERPGGQARPEQTFPKGAKHSYLASLRLVGDP